MGALSARGNKNNKGFWPDGTLIIHVHFSAILFWAIVMLIFMFAAGTVFIIAQTSDPPPRSEEIQGDTVTEVESPDRYNDLRKEHLDARSETVDWWLIGITIVLGLFAIAAAIFGFFGIREFQILADKARQHVDKIEQDTTMNSREFIRIKDESEQYTSEIRAHLSAVREGRKASDQGPAQVRPDIRSVFDVPSEELPELLDGLRQMEDLSSLEKSVIDAFTLHYQDGKTEEAIQKLRSIVILADGLEDNHLASRSWESIGYFHLDGDNREEALTAFDNAIRLKHDGAEVYTSRGDVRFLLEDYRFAIVDYSEAIRLGANLEEMHTQRANARNSLNEYNEAIVDCDEAIRLNPDYAEAYAVRGEAKIGLSKRTKAKADFQIALKLAEEQNNEDFSNQMEQRLQEL